MIRRPPRSTLSSSSAASDVYKRQFYTRQLTAAEKAQKVLNDLNISAQQSIVGEKIALEQLLNVARNEALSKVVRQEAMDRINQISPEYLGNITLEGVNTETAAIVAVSVLTPSSVMLPRYSGDIWLILSIAS